MRVFTYSEARQNLSSLLSLAQREDVEIRRKDGSIFSVRAKRTKLKSPFDVEGINTRATTQDILDAVSKSRQRPAKATDPDIEALANAFNTTRLEEGENMAGDSSRHQVVWLPRCAAPDKLYDIYANPDTTIVVTGTRDDGLSDLDDLQIQPGLSEKDFKTRVRETLRQLPVFAGIIDIVPQWLSDSDGILHIQEARPDLMEEDVRAQWRIVREWIEIFFEDQFEVAPESFVLRLRSRS